MEPKKFYKIRLSLRMFMPFLCNAIDILDNTKVDNKIKTMSTDGKSLFYNEEFVNKLDFEDFKFIVLHEMYHVLYKHHLRLENRNPKLWNIAGDLKINTDLKYERSEYEKKEIKYSIPKEGLFVEQRKESEIREKSTEKIYAELEKEIEKAKKDGKSEIEYCGMKIKLLEAENFNEDVIYSKNEKETSRLEKELNEKISNASNMCRMAGQGCGPLDRFVIELFKTSLKWYQEFEKRLKKGISDECSFKSPKLWSIQSEQYIPGEERNKNIVNDVYIGIDTSGSISDEDLGKFLYNIRTVTNRCKVKKCKVAFWDTEVTNLVELNKLKQSMTKKEAEISTGRGGTDVNCFLEIVNKTRCKQVIILTDGYFYGNYKIANNLKNKVIWVIIDNMKFDNKGVGKVFHI